MSGPQVLVAGGGVVGLSVAWRAAGAGLTVALVDPGADPGEASAGEVAAGMLAPVTEIHFGEEPLLRLNLASARLFPAFVADLEEATGRPTGYRATGTVTVARDHDDLRAIERVADYARGLGAAVQRLDARGVRAREPALSPGIRGGVLAPDDHQVDPALLLAALRAGCRAAGVDHVAETVVAMGADPRPRVALSSGRSMECETLVIAAGASVAGIAGLPGELSVVRPVKGQVVTVRDPAGRPPVGANVRGLEVYLVPRPDGRVVIGATVEERVDRTVTAGGVLELLRGAYELVPAIAECDFTGARAGLRPATPDNAPMIGPTSVPSVIAAAGHYRNGVLLAPITADAVTASLTGAEPPAEVGPLSPLRFATPEVTASCGWW